MMLRHPASRLLPGATTLAVLLASTALAQEVAEPIVLEPITITGQKVTRSLQETASSVTVISGDDTDRNPAAATVEDALQGTPNLIYTSPTDAPIIRGIDTKGPVVAGNAYLAKPIPRATISVDGRYLSPAEYGFGAASVWDVDGVEVFRGPQTTTQGANSIAGAVVINTKDPTFTPEYAGQIVAGSQNRRRLSLMASGPLSEELAGRVALDYSSRDTFIDYTNPEFTAHDFDLGFKDMTLRAKLLWQPVEWPGFEAKLTYAHTRAQRPSGESATAPLDDLKSGTLYVDRAETDTDALILDLRQDFDNGMVLSNTLQYSTGDYDHYFAEPFAGTAARRYHTLAEELRLNVGDEASTFSGVAALFYSKDRSHNQLDNALGSTDARLGHESLGVFSELRWRFAEQWSLTGGLRYQQDRITHDGVASYVPGVHHDYDRTFHALLPSLTLAYEATPEVTLGALVSKGYLPGGTGVNFSGGAYYEFDAETAWNYELFTRANLMDNRLMLTANLFYTRYTDAQRSVTDYLDGRPFGSIIVNSDKAEAWGLEASADFQARDNLRLRGSLGLLKTRISQFSDYRGNSFEGNEFAKAPGYMVSLGADWDITPQWRLSGDLRHVDGYMSDDSNTPDYEVDGYTVANLRLSYAVTDSSEFFVYANNIFDERVPLQKSFDRTANAISATMLEPREVGLGLSMQF